MSWLPERRAEKTLFLQHKILFAFCFPQILRVTWWFNLFGPLKKQKTKTQITRKVLCAEVIIPPRSLRAPDRSQSSAAAPLSFWVTSRCFTLKVTLATAGWLSAVSSPFSYYSLHCLSTIYQAIGLPRCLCDNDFVKQDSTILWELDVDSDLPH